MAKPEFITKPEETENYIRIPTGNSCTITATIWISRSKGIKALYCGKIKKIRTYLFMKSKGWTMAKAQAWVKAHKSDLEEREVIMDAEANTPHRFKINLPILKTRIRVIQDEKGTEVEERFVTGVASSTDIDKHGDKMTSGCLKIMADSLKQHILYLNAEHDTSWQSELGDLEKLEVNDKNQLVMEAKLNKMSKSKDLWYALTELKKKLGLSIGGYVKEYEMVKDEEDEDNPRWRRVFKDIELDHIAVTSSPANPKTWVDVITKSLDPVKEKKLLKNTKRSIDMGKETKKEIKTSKEEEQEEEQKKTKEKETKKEEKKETKKEIKKETKKEEKPEETKKEEKKVKPEEKKETKPEEKKEVKKSEKGNELLKAINGVTDNLKALVKSNQEMAERLEKLEQQPAGRKVAIEKTLGDTDEIRGDGSEKAMKKEIAKLKDNHPNDPYLFSKIQRIREKYSQE